LIWEAGGNEDEAIAGLAHDLMEDLNIPYNDVRYYFGQIVADIVQALTEDETLPLELRKEAYVDAIACNDKSVALVSAADKLHNLRGYCQNPKLVTPEVVNFYYKLYSVYRSWLQPVNENFLIIPKNVILAEMRDLLVNKLSLVYTFYIYQKEGEDSRLIKGSPFPSQYVKVATSTELIDRWSIRGDEYYPSEINLADGNFTRQQLIDLQDQKYPKGKSIRPSGKG
jgi:hypothetical protein